MEQNENLNFLLNKNFLRVLDIFSTLSLLFCVYLIITTAAEYQDVAEININGSNEAAILNVMQRIEPGRYNKLMEYQEKQKVIGLYLAGAIVLFVVTGIPKWKKKIEKKSKGVLP